MDNKILDNITNEIIHNKIDNIDDKNNIVRRIEQLKRQRLNVMFVGPTGVGKSSTINAIFNMEIAKVGVGVDPETANIQKYEVDNIILWDTPGLGDNPQKDKLYALEIANTLKQKDANGELLIDEVVILIDGSNRDMKTAYEIIENLIVPYIGDTKRIVLAINQCDMALKGRYWNYDMNQPDEHLVSFLNEKATSVRNRILETTGIVTNPLYYSALYHYNISKLLLNMITSLGETKRFLLTDSLNRNPDIWKNNDELENYNNKIQEEVKGSLSKALDGAAKGAVAGATVGGLIPVIGPVVGAAVGAVLGFLGGLIE
ncbi:GTPase family protein [Faecalimonas sp.]